MNVSKIDQFCKLHGLSRTDLEAAAGLSNGAIGKWERSIYGPSLSQLLKLAKYFKVTLNELVEKKLLLKKNLLRNLKALLNLQLRECFQRDL